MKRIIIMLTALLGSAVLISSCSKDQPVVYSLTNQDFVTKAASGFNFQIQAGNMAETKGVNDSVKSYGRAMVSANTMALAALKTLASQKGLTVSSTLQTSDQANLSTFSGLSGTAFDQSYAQMMVTTHNQEASLFNLGAQSNGVPDADIRAFSFGQLPLLNLQLQSAYTLQAIVASKQ